MKVLTIHQSVLLCDKKRSACRRYALCCYSQAKRADLPSAMEIGRDCGMQMDWKTLLAMETDEGGGGIKGCSFMKIRTPQSPMISIEAKTQNRPHKMVESLITKWPWMRINFNTQFFSFFQKKQFSEKEHTAKNKKGGGEEMYVAEKWWKLKSLFNVLFIYSSFPVY